MRARYSRRHRGSVNRRQYGLAGLLVCASCGRRLIGHVGRYRHTDACEPFKAAAPRRVQRDGATIDPRVRGESYKSDLYEAAIGRAFEHVAVSSRLKVDTVAIARRPDPDGGDDPATARIARGRDRAALRFARDRDLGQLEATMARLDAEAAAAVVRPSRIPTAADARAYLESPDLWAKTSDAGRHAIAEAVFERIEVLGVTDYTFTLTAHAKARGWHAAFGAGVVRVQEGQSGLSNLGGSTMDVILETPGGQGSPRIWWRTDDGGCAAGAVGTVAGMATQHRAAGRRDGSRLPRR